MSSIPDKYAGNTKEAKAQNSKPKVAVKPHLRGMYADPLNDVSEVTEDPDEPSTLHAEPAAVYSNIRGADNQSESSEKTQTTSKDARKIKDEKKGTSADSKSSKPVIPAKPREKNTTKLPHKLSGHIYENLAAFRAGEVPAEERKDRDTKTSQTSKVVDRSGLKLEEKDKTLDCGEESADDLEMEDEGGEDIYNQVDLYACYSSTQESEATIDSFQRHLLNRISAPDTLMSEFEELHKGMPHPHDVGMDPKNSRKNRFQKLCAYDKNRVILLRPKTDHATDYINASWIKGLKSDRAYIATQGPRSNAISDLWWMVWQENVSQIVMLTNCKEEGKDKCDQYWPEAGDTMTFGHVTVTSQREDERSDFTIRTFHIHLETDKKTQRFVHQYHYVVWPDHGVPAAGSLVNFWRYVTARSRTSAPPVIHCSAGVGRTGTYIALDIAMSHSSRVHDVNIFDIVMELREQRSIMVQTVVQYKFLHEVILEAYTSRNSRLTMEQLDLKFPKDIDVNKPNDVIDDEFKMLKEMKEWAKPNHMSAELGENKGKNRDPTVLPDDQHIAYLSVYVRGRNQYINAVYLSSFQVQRGLLLTQLPLPNTLVDLWRLVEGCGVNTIVSLGGMDDHKKVKNHCQYWPRVAGEELTTGRYKLQLSSLHTYNKVITTYNVTVGNQDESQAVKIVHYTDWSGELPGDISDVTYLVNAVHAATDESDSPVVIQCLDGATKSGLFCVLFDVFCRMTEDDEVDIFPTVRYVQSVRREAVASQRQYRYCYKLAQEIKRSRSVYANT